MDPTPYLRLSKARPHTVPPRGFVDLYYDTTLGRMATMGSNGQINSPDVPVPAPAQWGFIIGDITAQTDLQSALNLRFLKSGGTITGNVTVTLVLQTFGLLVSDSVSFAATNYAYAGGPTGPNAAAHRTAMGAAGGTGTANGTNTGDQVNITGNAGTVTTIAGHITAGTGIALTGSGTVAAPYVIAATAMADVGLRSHDTTDDEITITDRYVRTTSPDEVIQRIPNDAVVDFPIGTRITFRQAGHGDVTLEPGAGVSLHGQVTTQGRNRSLGIIKVGPNEWDTERGAF